MNIGKIIIIILLLGCAITCPAQPEVDWFRTYGGEREESFADIYKVADNGYVLCGRSGTYNSYPYDENDDIWAVRIDDDGDVTWSRRYGEDRVADRGFSVIETDFNEFMIGGTNNGNIAALLIDSDGGEIWYNSYMEGECWALIELKGGNYVLAGNRSDFRANLVCIDHEGN